MREWRDPRPLVDLKVFKNRAFAAGNAIGIVTGFGLFGTALVLPLFFQNVLGFSATETGMALLPGAIATAASMPIASRLVQRFDGRALIAFGLLVFAFSAWWMGGINQDSGYWDVFWPRAGLASGVTRSNPTVDHFLRDLHGTVAQLDSMVMLNATVLSYDMVLRLCAIVFVLSTPLVLLLNWRKTAAPGAAAAALAE